MYKEIEYYVQYHIKGVHLYMQHGNTVLAKYATLVTDWVVQS